MNTVETEAENIGKLQADQIVKETETQKARMYNDAFWLFRHVIDKKCNLSIYGRKQKNAGIY